MTRPSDDQLEIAALENLGDLPECSADFPETDQTLNHIQRWIDEKKRWIATLEDRRIRSAYSGWIDYVQNNVDENREENRTHRQAIEDARLNTDEDNDWTVGVEIAQHMPKPPR